MTELESLRATVELQATIIRAMEADATNIDNTITSFEKYLTNRTEDSEAKNLWSHTIHLSILNTFQIIFKRK